MHIWFLPPFFGIVCKEKGESGMQSLKSHRNGRESEKAVDLLSLFCFALECLTAPRKSLKDSGDCLSGLTI